MTRYTYKIQIKEEGENKRAIIEALRDDYRIEEFCFYRKKKEPHRLACIIRLRMQSKPTALAFLDQNLLFKGAYRPKKRICDMQSHYQKKRNECEYYTGGIEEDQRTKAKLQEYVRYRIFHHNKKWTQIMAEAYTSGDVNLFCHIDSEWKHYSHFYNLLEQIRSGDAANCKN